MDAIYQCDDPGHTKPTHRRKENSVKDTKGEGSSGLQKVLTRLSHAIPLKPGCPIPSNTLSIKSSQGATGGRGRFAMKLMMLNHQGPHQTGPPPHRATTIQGPPSYRGPHHTGPHPYRGLHHTGAPSYRVPHHARAPTMQGPPREAPYYNIFEE